MVRVYQNDRLRYIISFPLLWLIGVRKDLLSSSSLWRAEIRNYSRNGIDPLMVVGLGFWSLSVMSYPFTVWL